MRDITEMGDMSPEKIFSTETRKMKKRENESCSKPLDQGLSLILVGLLVLLERT